MNGSVEGRYAGVDVSKGRLDVAVVRRGTLAERFSVATLVGVAPFARDSGKKRGKREVWGGWWRPASPRRWLWWRA